MITGRTGKSNPTKTYILDSSSSTFTWSLIGNGTQEEQRASTYLTRLIVTRTGLSLRDLTSIVEPLLIPLPEQKR